MIAYMSQDMAMTLGAIGAIMVVVGGMLLAILRQK